ncbi:MAG: serine/threonine protein kinase [Planctomycetes bacterium]|nr:serine/threonine protein kinase [Planctomycetota bacterium]
MDKFQSLFTGGEKVDIAMRFELLSEGFVGTMSRFHKARDRKHNRIVGLKLCDLEKTSLFEARFPGLKKPPEGEIAMSLKHERIVETFEYGVSVKGQAYIVMEFLPGPGLQQLVRQKDERLAGKRLNLIRQMAEAVLAVHEAGYIHRDVCPRNFICSDTLDSLKLIDFGLTLPDEPGFRQPGNRTGTPMYMAPEIVRRRPTDRRVDIFALGVTAYELLAFELPWPWAEATGRGALAHDTDSPVPLIEAAPWVNRHLAAAITDCMAAEREQRPPTLDVFLNRIQRLKDERES